MGEFIVTQKLPVERVANVLCSALEGGSNYWYFIEDVVEPTSWEYEDDLPPSNGQHYYHDYPLNPGGALLITDQLDQDHGLMRLHEIAVQKGLTIMAEKYPQHFANILTENDDAETGDVLLQCCLFGEIIYG